jgi:hypothetical protein
MLIVVCIRVLAFSAFAYSWGKRIFYASITSDVTAETLGIAICFEMANRASTGVTSLDESWEALSAWISSLSADFAVVSIAFIAVSIIEPISIVACFAVLLGVITHSTVGYCWIAWRISYIKAEGSSIFIDVAIILAMKWAC